MQRRKKPIEWHQGQDQLYFLDDQDGARYTEYVEGTDENDWFVGSAGDATLFDMGAGEDTLHITGGSGRVNAGLGADMISVSNDWSGTIDLGNDQDGDVVIVFGNDTNVRLVNFNAELDAIVYV